MSHWLAREVVRIAGIPDVGRLTHESAELVDRLIEAGILTETGDEVDVDLQRLRAEDMSAQDRVVVEEYIGGVVGHSLKRGDAH